MTIVRVRLVEDYCRAQGVAPSPTSASRTRSWPASKVWFTAHQPDGEQVSIWDASTRYQGEGVSLVVLGGKEYGTGSSRDWAAKGPRVLGVQAVVVEIFECIHRSNLIGMGVLPLQFEPGQSVASLGLTGHELIDISGIEGGMAPRQRLAVRATAPDGSVKTFNVISRIDTPIEVEYYNHDGILPTYCAGWPKANAFPTDSLSRAWVQGAAPCRGVVSPPIPIEPAKRSSPRGMRSGH